MANVEVLQSSDSFTFSLDLGQNTQPSRPQLASNTLNIETFAPHSHVKIAMPCYWCSFGSGTGREIGSVPML